MFSHKRFGATVEAELYVEWIIGCVFYKASSEPYLWEVSLSSYRNQSSHFYVEELQITVILQWNFADIILYFTHNPGYHSIYFVLCSGILHLYFHHCEALCLEYIFLHLGLILFKYSAVDD